MASLEEGSDRYQQWTGKKWVKGLRWLLIGGMPKGGYKAVLDRRGKVIRPLGIVAACGIVLLLVLTRFLLADEIVTALLQRGLEQANGATVDVQHAELSFSEGRLSVKGLAMADPNALDTNLLQAATLTADVSTSDLLRKRITLDNVTLNDAATGAKRTFPGHIVGQPPQPSETPKTKDGEKTIEDYIDQAKQIKQRLAQLREWWDRINSVKQKVQGEGGPTLQDRLKQRIADSGYANVTASHLIEATPTFTVRQLDAEKVHAVQLDGELLNIHGRNLSTQPALLDEPPQITITTAESDKLLVDVRMAAQAERAAPVT